VGLTLTTELDYLAVPRPRKDETWTEPLNISRSSSKFSLPCKFPHINPVTIYLPPPHPRYQTSLPSHPPPIRHLGRSSTCQHGVKFATIRRRLYFLQQGTVINSPSVRPVHSYLKVRNHAFHQLFACSRRAGFKSLTVYQACTHSGLQIARATKFYTVATNVCGSSVWYFFHVTLLTHRILR
jgi:hypothetical protein